jgi:hypothetical protein
MTRNPKLLIGIAVAVAVIAAYWMLLLTPQRQKAADLDTQIDAKQAEIQQAETTLASYEKARSSYKTNYATLVRLGKAVPTDDDVRSLMVQLESAAGGTAVDFRTIQVGGGGAGDSDAAGGVAPPPGAVSVGAGFSALPITLTFDGQFSNMTGFFTQLEKFVRMRNEQLEVTGRLMRVERFSLAPSDAGFPNIKAEIGASSYIVPATEGITGGATAAGPSGAKPASSSGSTKPAVPTTTAATTAGATR